MLLYNVLGVPSGASAQQCRRAYREKVFALHPDRSAREDSTLAFQRVAFAYEVIRDERLRRIYDHRGLEAVCRAAGTSLDRTMWPEAVPSRRRLLRSRSGTNGDGLAAVRARRRQAKAAEAEAAAAAPMRVTVPVSVEDVYQQRCVVFAVRVTRPDPVEKQFRVRFVNWDQVRAGTTLVLKNQGNRAGPTGALGDVHVQPKLSRHGAFAPWNRHDLIYECPLTAEQQRGGFSVLLRLPDESATLVRISSDNACVSEARKQRDAPWAAGTVVKCASYGLCKRTMTSKPLERNEVNFGHLYIRFADA